MYFPYLHGRRSEFLALRAMLHEGGSLNQFLPIIEPVNADASDLLRCISTFDAAKKRVAVVLNSAKHELQGESHLAWLQTVLPQVQQSKFVVPVFLCGPQTSIVKINQLMAEFSDRTVALMYSSASFSVAELHGLAANASIEFHIILDGRMSDAQQALLPVEKRVDIRDCFNKQTRNADYGEAEFFTDRHATLTNFAGFGDYTSVGAEFNPGGGPAAAVAIHAIFKNAAGDIWVEHFVSDDTHAHVGDAASKYLQAAQKLVSAANARPDEFGSNFALDAYQQNVANHHFPGLGTNKVQQLGHHMCLMLDVLEGAV